MKSNIGCEAEHHHPNCPCSSCSKKSEEVCLDCPNLNRDHITPKALARLLHWSEQQIGNRGNI